MFQKLSFKTIGTLTVAAAVLAVQIVVAAQLADAGRSARPNLGLSPEALETYQQSERSRVPLPAERLSEVGLAIYHASEWGSIPSAGMSAEGLAIYQASEHSLEPVVALGLTAEGVALYQESERGGRLSFLTIPPHVAHPGR
jgi:hypothetical protein